MRHGKTHWLGLGPLHTVSLAEARNRARDARQLLLDGKDPINLRREARAAEKIELAKAVTFEQAALDFLKSPRVQQFKNAKHRQQWAY